MRSHPLEVASLFFLCLLCGCQSVQHPDARLEPGEASTSQKSPSDLATRNNALALLDDLLGDEKNLSKILIIKHNSDELGKLVEEISKSAGEGEKMLQSLAKQEPELDLKALNLPPGEMATRKAISKTKEQLLLHSKDAEFEFQLLLTQVEALNYGAHLALVAAENEPQVETTRDLLRLSARLRELHEQVLVMLRKPH